MGRIFNRSDKQHRPKLSQELIAFNDDGIPSGGITAGIGFTIAWHDGPTHQRDGDIAEQNGALEMDLLQVTSRVLEAKQKSLLGCSEMIAAIQSIQYSLKCLGRMYTRISKELKDEWDKSQSRIDEQSEGSGIAGGAEAESGQRLEDH